MKKREKRYSVDGTELAGPKYDDHSTTLHAASSIPDDYHLAAMDDCIQAFALQIARAHSVAEMAAQRLRAKFAGGDLVTRDSFLADAVGLADHVRAVNALEGAGISTVGKLLDCLERDPGRLTAIPNFEVKSIVAVLAAILRTTVGRDAS